MPNSASGLGAARLPLFITLLWVAVFTLLRAGLLAFVGMHAVPPALWPGQAYRVDPLTSDTTPMAVDETLANEAIA